LWNLLGFLSKQKYHWVERILRLRISHENESLNIAGFFLNGPWNWCLAEMYICMNHVLCFPYVFLPLYLTKLENTVFFLPQMAENNLSNIVSQQARLVKRKGAGWQVQD